MTKDEFEEIILNKIEDIRSDIYEHMPDKGNKCLDSQKICLIQSLWKFEMTVNGLEEEDFKPNKIN